MKSAVGIFTSRADAERAIQDLRSIGIKEENLSLISPGASADQIEDVPTTEAEQPGMGGAIGGVVGGALGAASGMSLGAAAASLLVPGVGPVMATGIIAAALFGLGGAVGGAAAGSALEEGMTDGLPKDEVYLYEDAVRRGRTVLVALTDGGDQTIAAGALMARAGAESLDSAREDWWMGLRDAEEESYNAEGREFATDESNYRCGFECAQHPDLRDGSYDESRDRLRERFGDIYSEDSFRRGFERGQVYNRG
ncbi:MAG TPA: hypothetical protein VKC34_14555, partial [Blastocatellia bacterium]|nr:hypothetical protein [Blastocatellia bacterium]